MGEQWYKHWKLIGGMKSAKFKTTYVEPVYPGEFKVVRRTSVYCWEIPCAEKWDWMPAMLTGWVQGEVHIQWGFQSLQ